MLKALVLPISASLLLHGLIIAALLIDWQQSPLIIKPPPPSFVRAELVTMEKPKAPPAAKPAPKEDAAEKRRQQEVAEQRQAEEKRQQALRREQALKKKQEQQKKEKELADQREAEQRRQQQQRLQQQAEQELVEAVAREEAQQQASSDVELANSYIAVISQAVQRNWSRPPSARNNMEAELAIQLVPTGDVVSVRVVKSSGNAAFDRSAESAVRRAGRFPELQKLPSRVFEQYFRQLRLKFRPEDLRL